MLLRSTRQAHREFDAFVERYSGALVRTGYLLVWDLAEAEDLVQECLLRVARHWTRVRRMEEPYAYARRVLVNLALTGAKRRGRRAQELTRDPSALAERSIGDGSEERETRAELRRALAVLTSRQRAIVVLRYFEDLSETQVAELLGCSAGNVKSTSARALGRLRDALAAEREAQGALSSRPERTCHEPAV